MRTKSPRLKVTLPLPLATALFANPNLTFFWWGKRGDVDKIKRSYGTTFSQIVDKPNHVERQNLIDGTLNTLEKSVVDRFLEHTGLPSLRQNHKANIFMPFALNSVAGIWGTPRGVRESFIKYMALDACIRLNLVWYLLIYRATQMGCDQEYWVAEMPKNEEVWNHRSVHQVKTLMNKLLKYSVGADAVPKLTREAEAAQQDHHDYSLND